MRGFCDQRGTLGDTNWAVVITYSAGIDPKSVGGHSLRAGFATTAAKKGKSLDAIMRQTLHRSEKVAQSATSGTRSC